MIVNQCICVQSESISSKTEPNAETAQDFEGCLQGSKRLSQLTFQETEESQENPYGTFFKTKNVQ